MQSSSSIAKIAPELVKAQSEMGNAKKDATNPFFKKNYADINSVREAIMPALNAHGICVIQPTTVIDGITYIETILLHSSGEFISSLTPVVVDKVNDAQRHGSGISYARRYALQSIANIGAEDDDGNAATGKKSPAAEKWQATPAMFDEVKELIDNSTLDANGRTIASNSFTNAKDQKEWDKLLKHLRTKQTAS